MVQTASMGNPMNNHRGDTGAGSAEVPGSATWLRELKTDLIEMIRSTELNDDEELCLKSQELIAGWVEVYFENKIFDEGIE
ncbi:MAG: hypothetical protein OEY01_14400 [Desulfobulbaceae bacterium]|nr:hypothetical protein [Desulfobulbaceae bacterium]